MKIKSKITSALHSLPVLILIIATLSMQSCKHSDATPSVADIITNQISVTPWKVKSVMVDGKDETDLFKGFTLQYTATNYATTNGTLVWPASGTWKFKDDTANVIVRNDGLEITIESITDTEFVYSLTWAKTTYNTGRASSIGGVHKFDMVH